MTEAFNMDCMEYMRGLPGNAFDLAVVDPPYGDGCGEAADTHTHTHTARDGSSAEVLPSNGERAQVGKYYNRFGGRFDAYKKDRDEDGRNLGGKVRKKIIAWDIAPNEEYFSELFRVSRNQIIWGGNYFALPPTRCFLIWKKTNVPENFSMAMCEYAWTSFSANAKVFEYSATNQYGRFHPTQKPVELYRWIFANYAQDGFKILDTHLGSGSSRIAAHDAGLEFVGCEIDEYYFRKQEERFAEHTAQLSIFNMGG